MRRLSLISLLALFISTNSFALSGSGGRRGVSLSGTDSLGVGLGLITASQNDMDGVIDSANTGGGTVKNLGSGLEYFIQYGFRVDRSWWGFVFRASKMDQSTSGTCQSGSCSYSTSGLAFFPMIRMVPLENGFIKLFFQVGLGYGKMEGKISQPAGSVKFEGSAFGAMTGLGVDFCFTETHCMTVEGNLRYLPIERNLLTSGATTGMTGVSTGSTATGDEIEKSNNRDLGTTMSGLQGLISYTMMF